jgi:hypothetical protein
MLQRMRLHENGSSVSSSGADSGYNLTICREGKTDRAILRPPADGLGTHKSPATARQSVRCISLYREPVAAVSLRLSVGIVASGQ